MTRQYLVNLSATTPRRALPLAYRRRRQRRRVGNKAEGLATLIAGGLRVPATYVCTWDAYEQFLSRDAGLERTLKAELSSALDLGASYAVRSSANVEDGAERSFAGQFESILEVQGLDALWAAIRDVWASACGPKVRAYQDTFGQTVDGLKMAVIIQEMVHPHVSGVAFSRNPITDMDEVVVEAVKGSGEALVQTGVAPERWVDKWGEWLDRSAESDVPEPVLREVVDSTRAVANVWRQPVDLEWVYDGQAVYWVQARAITSLANLDLYSNRIAREVLPGQIKPLVWSVNVPLVNSAWVRLFTEMIGPNDIDPDRLARAFYYRAYFNMGVIGELFSALGMPRDSLELLLGIGLPDAAKPSFRPTLRTLIHTPRLLRFVGDKARFERRVDAFLPQATADFAAFARADLGSMDASTLLQEVDVLTAVARETAYFNIVAPLLMQLYNRMLERALVRNGYDPASIDMTKGLDALDDLNPNVHLEKLNRHFTSLDPAVQAEIRQGADCSAPAADFQRALQGFVERFGHLSDSGNDFSATPWREDPAFVLKMVRAASSPVTSNDLVVGFDELDLSPLRRRLLGPLYRRARRYRLYREQISSLYTFGYGLFRNYFLALGERLVERGVLACREDIFYLYMDEVRAAVAADDAGHAGMHVSQRRQEMDAYRDIMLPSIIYGDEPPPPERPSVDRLAGTPTARGYYQGAVCVVRGRQDFDRVAEGDVLVVPFSDVGWSPLFAKAGAVIAESGGMLSHSSIIAREYRIPAVVSVTGACQLPDGVTVTVDGYSGQITVHEIEEA